MNNCRWCNNLLPTDAKCNRVFCDSECSRAWAKKEWREKNPKSAWSAFNRGTLEEINLMRVCLDLMARGCQVYRAAFSGMNCDLLIELQVGVSRWKEGVLRVEVMAGNYSYCGTLTYPMKNMDKYDIAAIVVGDKIVYEPEIG